MATQNSPMYLGPAISDSLQKGRNTVYNKYLYFNSTINIWSRAELRVTAV